MIYASIFNPDPTFTTVKITSLTASQAVMTDANKQLVSVDYLNQAVKTTSSPTFANITDSGLTITRIPYASTAGLLVDSANLTFDGTSLTLGALKGLVFSGTYSATKMHNPVVGAANNFTLQNTTSGQTSFFQILPNDLDGTDYVAIRLVSKAWTTGPVYGIAGIDVNDVRLVIRYNTAGTYDIFSGSTGAGAAVPLKLYVGTFTNQLVLATNGNVGINQASPNYQLDVNGNIYVNGILYLGDLELYHDGDDAYITNGVGTMIFTGAATFSSTLGVTGLSTLTGGILIASAGNIEKQTNDLTITTASEKTVVLSQPVYQDINLGAANFIAPSAGYPDKDELVDEAGADTGIETFAFGLNEGISSQFEIQHDYKEGTDLTFHVHWEGITAPAGGTDNVQWRLAYTITRDGQTINAVTTIDSPDKAITAQYQCNRSDFGAIAGATGGYDGGVIKIGDQFCFKLSRVAATADEYGGDALLITAGVHYQIDTIGSRTILAK